MGGNSSAAAAAPPLPLSLENPAREAEAAFWALATTPTAPWAALFSPEAEEEAEALAEL